MCSLVTIAIVTGAICAYGDGEFRYLSDDVSACTDIRGQFSPTELGPKWPKSSCIVLKKATQVTTKKRFISDQDGIPSGPGAGVLRCVVPTESRSEKCFWVPEEFVIDRNQ